MTIQIRFLAAILVVGITGVAAAATFTVTNAAADGAGSFSQAIRNADASADPTNTIAFNLPGAGPYYIAPPVGGFPLVIKANTTIDGYSQPGSSVNTQPITQTNDAVIQIVLDARPPNANFRDLAYVWYGTFTTSDPVIDNSAMAGSPPGTNPERGGYREASLFPYLPGEVAILGIYRATNVTVKGLAFLGDGSGSDYAIALALDYGLDPAVKDRFAYPQGSAKSFHLAGCWFGTDPGTGLDYPSGTAIAAFRHQDKAVGGTRPELPNLEHMTLGVAAGAAQPRAEFNVLTALGLTLAGEGIRCTVAGNQFLGADPQIGGYDDTQVPSLVFGTDGDGVNDAEEGNLFPTTTLSLYGTGNQVIVIAGNTFGLARDGTRPQVGTFAVDEIDLNQSTKVRFGSDFNGVSDAAEANTLYDTWGFSVNPNAPDNQAGILLRGNSLVNNQALPMDEVTGLNTYNKFIDTTAANPITPVITAATPTSLTGTCGLPLPGVAAVVVDVYGADPEGDLAGIPQGKTYLGSFADNGLTDSNPAIGAFTFNTTGLGITSGTALTITANYLKPATAPTITSVVRGGGNTTLTISGGAGPYDILRAATVSGPYTHFTTATGSPAVFADAATTSFYQVGYLGGGGQTSPFAISVTVP